MQLIKPSISLEWMTPTPLLVIEQAGRTCWKSEGKIEEGSDERFARMLLVQKHYAMIEHASASYRVICDRGVTHELVLHRLFSYAQESTRYCNYSGGVTFIIPCWMYEALGTFGVVESTTDYEYYLDTFSDLPGEALYWLHAMACAEVRYQIAIDNLEWTPQQARSVLPNSLKTEIVVTGNLREWMHFFDLHTASAAHPQMREIAFMLLDDIHSRIPVLFDKLSRRPR